MKVGIIGAEKQEVTLLFAALSGSGDPVRVTKRGSLEFHEGTLSGCPSVVVCCGVGKVNAALCAQMLISEFGVECVVNTGSAGGTAEGLRVLDMVVCTDAVQHDFDTTPFGYKPGQIPGTDTPFFPADARLRSIALEAHGRVIARDAEAKAAAGIPELHRMVEGRVASGDAFITDEIRRARIVSLFAPACVEMEGAAIAQVCAVNGIPFAVLRSISDLAGAEAGMSYEEFSRIASEISAHVVIEMAAAIGAEKSR
jgi:adenosylhomocysteine nucleosidase